MSLPTLLGFCAILLWSQLALLTALSGAVPPFQLAAMTFAVGGLVGCASWIVRPQGVRTLRQPWPVWLLGIGGLFGYHALYFVALRLAPPAEAGLISYLWPLLIVLLSARLPGAPGLRTGHLGGAALGLAGVAALFAGRGGLDVAAGAMPGDLAALAAAFVWAGYSVLSARAGAVPTDAVAGFCLATAALSLACHRAVETTLWPDGAVQWGAIVALGLGPVGAAFYLWDIGMKRGDLRLLGVAAYAAPILSTLTLVAAGHARPSAGLGLACLLIVLGAVVAVRASRAGPVSAGAPGASPGAPSRSRRS